MVASKGFVTTCDFKLLDLAKMAQSTSLTPLWSPALFGRFNEVATLH
jgi:hypothetical protein